MNRLPGASLAGPRWREREYTWFCCTLICVSLMFSLWPEVDPWVSSRFYDGVSFTGQSWAWVQALYIGVPWAGRIAFLTALPMAFLGRRKGRALASTACSASPHHRPALTRWRRRWMALGLSLLLGAGLLINGALKEHWGRARPNATTPFGGTSAFTPALRPTVHCQHNCSFVSGHAATGFALASIGLFGAPRTRRRWLVIGASAGLTLGLARVSQGAHFASDVLFSGLVMWLTHLLMRDAVLLSRRRWIQRVNGTAMASQALPQWRAWISSRWTAQQPRRH